MLVTMNQLTDQKELVIVAGMKDVTDDPNTRAAMWEIGDILNKFGFGQAAGNLRNFIQFSAQHTGPMVYKSANPSED